MRLLRKRGGMSNQSGLFMTLRKTTKSRPSRREEADGLLFVFFLRPKSRAN